MLNNKNIYKALGFSLVGIIGLLLLVDTFFEHQYYRTLKQDGVTTNGVLMFSEVETGQQGAWLKYTIRYYDSQNKQQFVHNNRFADDVDKQKYFEGDTLQVVYDKQDPSKAVLKIELNSSFLGDYVVTVLMLCLLIVAFILYRKGKNKSNPHNSLPSSK